MHITSVSAKHGTAVFNDDDASTGGTQRINVYGGHVEVRVIGPTTYFTGDPVGLTKYMGLNARQIRRTRGRWLSLTAGEADYPTVTEGVTLASALDEVRIHGTLRRLPERIKDGQRVFGIEGAPVGPAVASESRATMWVTSGSTALPFEYDASDGANTEVVRFTNWGDPVAAAVPRNVVAAARVLG